MSITRKLVGGVVGNIDGNFSNLCDAVKADERAAVANEIMNLIFAGSFCFAILDRLTGDRVLGYEGVASGSMAVVWIYPTFSWALDNFPVWFILNMIWLLSAFYFLRRLFARS